MNPTLALFGEPSGFRAVWFPKVGGMRRASLSAVMASALLEVRNGTSPDVLFDAEALQYLSAQGFLVPRFVPPKYVPPGPTSIADDAGPWDLDPAWQFVAAPERPVGVHIRTQGPRFVERAPWGIAEERAADAGSIRAYAQAVRSGLEVLDNEARAHLAGLGVLRSAANRLSRRQALEARLHHAQAKWAEVEWCAVEFITEAEREALGDYVNAVIQNGHLDGDFGVGGKQRTHVYDDPELGFLLDRAAQLGSAVSRRRLVGSYSFLAFYQPGGGLPKHRDKAHCELSFSLCIEASEAVVERWPLELEDEDTSVTQLRWRPGEAAFFNGRRYAHHRAPLKEAGPAIYLVLHLMTDPEIL